MGSIRLKTGPIIEPLAVDDTPTAKFNINDHLKMDNITDDNDLIKQFVESARAWCEGYMRRSLLQQTWELRLDSFPFEIVLPNPPVMAVTSVKYLDGDGDLQTVSTSVYDVDTYAEPGIIRLAFGQSWPATRGIPNSVIVEYEAGYGIGRQTFTAADTDICTATDHGLQTGQLVRVTTTAADLPGGLAIDTTYYVIYLTDDTFSLATTEAAARAGTAIDITDEGAGTHTIGTTAAEVPAPIVSAMKLLIGHWYEHREDIVIGVSAVEVPMAAKPLLFPYRVLDI